METNTLAVYEQPRTLLIPTEQTSNSASALAKLAAASGLCKTRQPADAFFIIMYGYELGIPAMTALRTIHIINNTPVCSGEAMLALIRRSGKVEIKINGTATEATVYMRRKDTNEEYTARWDIQRATIAGLSGKQTWKNFPQAFLQWRGVSECGKFLCSDIIGGLYTFEEIAPDAPVDENGEPVEGQTITISKPEPDAPKMASCLKTNSDCQHQFSKLCGELGITNDEPYLHALKVERYSEYPGTFDELCNKMRELFVWFVNEGHRVGEDEPASEPDPVATAAAQITVDDTKNLLNTQTGSSTRKPSEDKHAGNVIDDPLRVITTPDSPFGNPTVTPTDTSSGGNGVTNGSAFNRAQDNYMATVEARRVAAINAQLDQLQAIAEQND